MNQTSEMSKDFGMWTKHCMRLIDNPFLRSTTMSIGQKAFFGQSDCQRS